MKKGMHMTHIKLLTTGGTIASKRDPETGLQQTGVISGEELMSKLNVDDKIKISVEEIISVSSSAMTFENLVTVKDRVNEFLKDTTVDSIVMTHGTDINDDTSTLLRKLL